MKTLRISGTNLFEEQHHNARRWVVMLGKRFTNGKAVKKRFSSYGEAKAWLLEQDARRKAQGASAFTLTAGQQEQAQRAFALLGGRATLEEAVEFFVKVRFPAGGTKNTPEVVAEWVKEKTAKKQISAAYLDTVRHIFDAIAAKFPGPIVDISSNELEEFLASKKRRDGQLITNQTFNHYVNDAKALFNFAIEKGWAGLNPASKIKKRGALRPSVGILTPREALATLRVAAEEENAPYVAFFALGMFAGIRTEEIARLDWSDVILDEEEPRVYIRPATAKGGEPRVVDLPPNLVAWLKLNPFRKGGIRRPTSRPMKRFRTAIGRKWPHNAARHSFVSYQAKLLGEFVASEQAGHESVKMTRKHYKKHASARAAKAYFALTPDTTPEQLASMLAPASLPQPAKVNEVVTA